MPVPRRGLSQENVIIIAVCAVVGGVIVIAILHWLFRTTARRAPLPPIQPLAHVRARELSKFEVEHYAEPAYLPPPLAPSLASSKVSLLRRESPSLTNESSEHSPSLSPPLDKSLSLPQHSFSHSSSSSSIGSSDHTALETPVSMGPPVQLRGHMSLRSQSSSSSHSHSHPHRNRPKSSYVARSRPLSVISTASSPSIRGVPHGPYSNVQIVLPAPLAHVPDLPLSRRFSVADKWVLGTIPSPSPSPSTSLGRSASIDTPQQPRRTSRRVSSVPSLGPDSATHPPPVPRIPSIYGSLPTEDPGPSRRGRSPLDTEQSRTDTARSSSVPPAREESTKGGRSKSRHKDD